MAIACVLCLSYASPYSVLAFTSSDDLVSKGRLYFEEGSYKEAIMAFNQAIEANPSNVQAYYLRGRTKIVFEDYH